MTSWTAVAVVMAVMAVGSQGHEFPEFPRVADIDMLQKKAAILQIKYDITEESLNTLNSAIVGNFDSMRELMDYLVSYESQEAQDSTLADSLEDQLQTFYADYMAQTMATASLQSRVDMTKDIYEGILEKAKSLEDQVEDQNTRACDVEDAADENSNQDARDLCRMVQRDMDKIEDTTTLLTLAAASQKCHSYLVNVNITAQSGIVEGRGLEYLNITEEFVVNGTYFQPSVYCAMTGLVSAINEPVRYSEEYDGYTGFLPPNRESSSFMLQCNAVDDAEEPGVDVYVVDMSGSARGEDEVQMVTVEVKACSFPPLSMHTDD